jgi:DNA repair exonuclease SbcCD ATPase subunit
MSEDATTPEVEIDEPVTEAEEVATAEPQDQNEGDDEGDGLDGDAEQTDASDDDLEDVEWDGKKARIPPEFKAALMRTKDYTEKTQEIAETRRALETERSTWQAQQAEQTAALEALSDDIGKAAALKTQIAAFKDVTWADAYREAALSDDPKAATREVERAEAHFKALQAGLTEAEKAVADKRSELQSKAQARDAAAMEEVGKTLQRDIPDWGPKVADAILEYALKDGYSLDEMKTLADPRAWKAFHRAASLDAENAKLKAQIAGKTVVDRHAKAAETTPAAPVRGSGPTSAGLSDGLSADEWAKRRNAQIAKRRAR